MALDSCNIRSSVQILPYHDNDVVWKAVIVNSGVVWEAAIVNSGDGLLVAKDDVKSSSVWRATYVSNDIVLRLAD